MSHSCLVCGNSNSHAVVVPKVAKSRFDVVHCPGCGLEYLHPQPTWEEIQEIYSSDYYATWDMKDGEKESTGKMKRLTFRRRLGELRRYVSSGAILDIGTATGFFLDEVRADGSFEPYGVEVSTYAGTIAQSKFGVDRIHIGTLETAPFEADFFSAVAMSDLIEHVQDPRQTLKGVHRILRQGGVAMIMTPDSASPTRRQMGARWTHFKLEHLFYFSPKAMHMLAAECGFEVLSLTRARKVMTLKYLGDQLQTYRHPLLTPASQVLNLALYPLRTRPFPITMGEMLVFLRKK
jgi:2-polyprenyl-3-methyl-5-hydroxy-6-metoxy-1,4-benzoquinol methylase